MLTTMDTDISFYYQEFIILLYICNCIMFSLNLYDEKLDCEGFRFLFLVFGFQSSLICDKYFFLNLKSNFYSRGKHY